MKNLLTLLSILLLSTLTLSAEVEKVYSAATKVTLLLLTTKTSVDQPISYLKTEKPEVRALLVELPVGQETGWHSHPVPCYGYILEGELTVEFEGGKSRTFRAGDALVEAVNTLHNGRNTGEVAVKLVMFVTGEESAPFTVRPEPAKE